MTAWILLRGLTREAAHWGDFPERMARAFRGVTVHAVDLPGNGTRHLETSPADVHGLLAACRLQLASLGVQPPFRVIAMSLGAMVTAEWAHQHPHELAGAVLISTSLRPWSPLHHRLRPAAWPTMVQAAIARDAMRRARAVWALTSRRPASERERVVAEWGRIHRARPVSTLNGLRQLWAAARYRAPPTPPPVPLLLLRGAGDRLVNPACSMAIARAWDVPCHTHPWAGHDLPLDDPDWVVATVVAWVSRPDAPLPDSVPLLP